MAIKGSSLPRHNTSKLEYLVKRYFKFYLEDYYREENYRPSWLKNGKGNCLELDIYYPEFKLAVEANGKQHKIIQSQINHDKIKKQKCDEMGIFLITVEQPKNLLLKDVREKLTRYTGIDFFRQLPHAFARSLSKYKPGKFKGMAQVMMREGRKKKMAKKSFIAWGSSDSAQKEEIEGVKRRMALKALKNKK
jgi:hypothetical protein